MAGECSPDEARARQLVADLVSALERIQRSPVDRQALREQDELYSTYYDDLAANDATAEAARRGYRYIGWGRWVDANNILVAFTSRSGLLRHFGAEPTPSQEGFRAEPMGGSRTCPAQEEAMAQLVKVTCRNCRLEGGGVDGIMARAAVALVACPTCKEIKSVTLWSLDHGELPELQEELDRIWHENAPDWEARSDEIQARIDAVRSATVPRSCVCPTCRSVLQVVPLQGSSCPRCKTGKLEVEERIGIIVD